LYEKIEKVSSLNIIPIPYVHITGFNYQGIDSRAL